MKETDRQIQKVNGAQRTTKVGARKKSYRPLQYILVVGSFVASLTGAVWLQSQDSLAASGTTVAAQASAPVSVESAPQVQQAAPTIQKYSRPRAVARSRSSR